MLTLNITSSNDSKCTFTISIPSQTVHSCFTGYVSYDSDTRIHRASLLAPGHTNLRCEGPDSLVAATRLALALNEYLRRTYEAELASAPQLPDHLGKKDGGA